MAKLVMVIGESGTGKTTALRNLDPKKTYVINADKKALPLKGADKIYSEELKNYAVSSDIDAIRKVLVGISEKRKDINCIVIDTINGIMIDKEMKEMKTKGYDKWMNLANDIYELFELINTEIRNDIVVVVNCHEERYIGEDSVLRRRALTNGRKLEKIVLESKATIVLFTKVSVNGSTREYKFETQTDGTSTAKSPMDMFKGFEIDNDLNLVINSINKYYE